MKDSDIDQFIHYYGKDQLSQESQDTDFNDAGQSLNEILDCSYGGLDEPDAEQQEEYKTPQSVEDYLDRAKSAWV